MKTTKETKWVLKVSRSKKKLLYIIAEVEECNKVKYVRSGRKK